MLKNKIFEAGNKFKTDFGGSDVPAKKKRKNFKEGHIQIESCEVKNVTNKKTNETAELAYVVISHVWPEYAEKLVDVLNAIPQEKPRIFQAMLYKVNDTLINGKIILRVSIKRKEQILKYTRKIEEAINKLGQYNEVYVNNLCTELFDRLDEIATRDDIEASKVRSINNWKEMFERLSDPEIRTRLLRYQMSKDCEIKYGHVLSPENVTEILNQFPRASFVAEKSTWKYKFNRAVNPNAQPIVVTKPINNGAKLDFDAAARECGFDSFLDAKKKTNNSTQVLNQIKITANKIANRFIKVKMYDVSETTPPSDPKLDIWTNEIGLLDNITGILNQAAQDADKKLSPLNKAEAEANKEEEVNVDVTSRWTNRREAIKNVCKRHKIDLSKFENLSDEKFITEATFYYAQKQAKQHSFIKDEDAISIAALVTGAICVSCDAQLPPYISKNLPNRIPENLCQTAYTIVSGLLPQLNKYTRAVNLNALQTESLNTMERKSLYLEYKDHQRKLQEAKYGMMKYMQENNKENISESNNVDEEFTMTVADFLDYCKNTLPKFE